MKYVVQVEIDGATGLDVEAQPGKIQQVVEKWQALNPIGMYFAVTHRAFTVTVDVPSEDALFEALHATWLLSNDYPEVWPVVDVQEFPALLKRVGIGA